jgi:riboflavin biosynthesis pyrimidine reductase
MQPARPSVTASFTVSWDGRMIDRRPPGKRVDAVLFGSEVEEWSGAGEAARVLVHAGGRMDAEAGFFEAGGERVIVYSPGGLARATQAKLVAMSHVRLHLRADGAWPLCEVLAHLGAMHGVRRVAFAGGPEIFRRLLNEGLLDELCLGWRPRIVGGKVPSITGRDRDFLPRGVVLDLLKLERGDDECVGHYRVCPAVTGKSDPQINAD